MKPRRSLWLTFPNRVWRAAVISGLVGIAVVTSNVLAEEESSGLPKNTPTAPHPLDKAMKMAADCVAEIKQNVDDYTATVVKREQVNGKLGEMQFMYAKVRNRKMKDGKLVTPFAVYMQFLKPDAVKGREVIWVEDQNDGKLVAHEAGLFGVLTVFLKPTGTIAMMGQRYPITKFGIQNLVEELIEKGEGQRKFGECEVQFFKNTKINNRVCTMIQVMHPERREHFDFYRARIYIDDVLNMPIRYAAWSWPETPGGDPVLLEEYTYLNLKLNVGLKPIDFDHTNPAYKFP